MRTKSASLVAFVRKLKASPALAAIVGDEPLSCVEAIRRVWHYVKEHNLHDRASTGHVLCDENLKRLLGKDAVSLFEITGLVSLHLS